MAVAEWGVEVKSSMREKGELFSREDCGFSRRSKFEKTASEEIVLSVRAVVRAVCADMVRILVFKIRPAKRCCGSCVTFAGFAVAPFRSCRPITFLTGRSRWTVLKRISTSARGWTPGDWIRRRAWSRRGA